MSRNLFIVLGLCVASIGHATPECLTQAELTYTKRMDLCGMVGNYNTCAAFTQARFESMYQQCTNPIISEDESVNGCNDNKEKA